MRTLASWLEDYGYNGDAQTFRELLMDTFAEMHRNMTDEDLLCQPTLALEFCYVIRKLARVADLPEMLILRTLTNIRKNSGLNK